MNENIIIIVFLAVTYILSGCLVSILHLRIFFLCIIPHLHLKNLRCCDYRLFEVKPRGLFLFDCWSYRETACESFLTFLSFLSKILFQKEERPRGVVMNFLTDLVCFLTKLFPLSFTTCNN